MSEVKMSGYLGIPLNKVHEYDVKSDRHEQLGIGPAIIYMAGKPVYPEAFTKGEIANMVDLSCRSVTDPEAAAEQTDRAAIGHSIIPPYPFLAQ